MFALTALCLTASILLFGLGGQHLIVLRFRLPTYNDRLAAQIRGIPGMVLIAANFLFSGIASQPLLQLTFQSYIVDCVPTEGRSPTFAMLGE